MINTDRVKAFQAAIKGMPLHKANQVGNRLTPGCNWARVSKREMANAFGGDPALGSYFKNVTIEQLNEVAETVRATIKDYDE